MVALVVSVISMVATIVAVWLAWPGFRSDRTKKDIESFRAERLMLSKHRMDLVREACALYPDFVQPGTCTLVNPEWRLTRPYAVEEVAVHVETQLKRERFQPRGLKGLLPRSPMVRSYTDAISHDPLITPELWDNRPSYDLRSIEVSDDKLTFVCGVIGYFEMLDTSEAIAHEFAAARRRGLKRLPLRRAAGAPFDIQRHPAVASCPTLILIAEPGGGHSFLLHKRGEHSVAVLGGTLHVVGGAFQPSSRNVVDVEADADVWLSVCREIAEEMLNLDEADGTAAGRLGFGDSPLRELEALRVSGRLGAWVLGVSVDSLNYWPDILVMVEIQREDYDAIFPVLTTDNPEGQHFGSEVSGGQILGFTFDASTLDRICVDGRTAPSATALLRLAWEARAVLRGTTTT